MTTNMIPLTQHEFFGLYAIFNNTADADRKDESPLVSIPWEPLDAKRRPLEKELAAILKAVPEMKKITPKKQVQPQGEPPELRPLRKHVDTLRKKNCRCESSDGACDGRASG